MTHVLPSTAATQPEARARVLVADPYAASRAGLRAALEPHGLLVTAQAADLRGALDAARAERPDLIVLAATLPGGDAGTIAAIREAAPGAAVVVLGEDSEEDAVVAAATAGAVGFVPRSDALAQLPRVLRLALDGYSALPSARLTAIADRASRERRRADWHGKPRPPLSPREREVLHALSDGASTREIAERLGVSPITVRRYVSGAVRKSGTSSRAGLRELVAERRAS